MRDNKIGVDPSMGERAIHLFRYQGKYCSSNSHTLSVSFEPQTANRVQTFVQNDNSVMNCLNLPAALKPTRSATADPWLPWLSPTTRSITIFMRFILKHPKIFLGESLLVRPFQP